MTRVLVVYAGLMGHTARMAERAADGAREAGAEALVMAADEATAAQVRWADALAVGAAVHSPAPVRLPVAERSDPGRRADPARGPDRLTPPSPGVRKHAPGPAHFKVGHYRNSPDRDAATA